MTWTKQ